MRDKFRFQTEGAKEGFDLFFFSVMQTNRVSTNAFLLGKINVDTNLVCKMYFSMPRLTEPLNIHIGSINDWNIRGKRAFTQGLIGKQKEEKM